MGDTYFLLVDLCVLACGAYLIYVFIKLASTGRLFSSSFIVPKGKEIKDCKDETAYMKFIKPLILLVGVILFFVGALSIVNEYITFMGLIVSEVILGIAVVALVLYAVLFKSAINKYW